MPYYHEAFGPSALTQGSRAAESVGGLASYSGDMDVAQSALYDMLKEAARAAVNNPRKEREFAFAADNIRQRYGEEVMKAFIDQIRAELLEPAAGAKVGFAMGDIAREKGSRQGSKK